ncbi:MAG: DeoR/GlpR transcriptional regulator [Rhodospirillales bacterium]|nr:DeoR/GlpR transcriptional regulator [Rhodospirillales bacterium]
MNTILQPPSLETLSPRQSDIIEAARESGRVTVDDLAVRFDVTPQTIRKDLNELCDVHIMQRVHGGAVLTTRITNLGYESRRSIAAEEKRKIGFKAASLIPNDCSLLINIGTTTEQVAHALSARKNLVVITNNINVVNILAGNPQIEVIVAGGTVRPSDGGVVGETASDFIRQFKVDYAIIGASAIDPDGSLLDYDHREVKVAQAIIENARNSILVADSMKYERSAPVRIGHISQLDSFVIDKMPPAELQQICAENEVVIEIAGSPDENNPENKNS